MDKLVKEIMNLEKKVLKQKCQNRGEDWTKKTHILSSEETLKRRSIRYLETYKKHLEYRLDVLVKEYKELDK